MSSTGKAERLDLERDLPTSPADVAALRTHRPDAMTWGRYLEFLARLPQPTIDSLRRRPPTTGEPFTLR
jgi:hypothetical protein